MYLAGVELHELKAAQPGLPGGTPLEVAVDDFFRRRRHVSAMCFVGSDRPLWTMRGGVLSGDVFGVDRPVLSFFNGGATKPLAPGEDLFLNTSWQRVR